jgi:hypothetical protein
VGELLHARGDLAELLWREGIGRELLRLEATRGRRWGFGAATVLSPHGDEPGYPGIEVSRCV